MRDNKIYLSDILDQAKFNTFHWKVVIWCLLIIIFDGYDLVIYGVALPLLMKEWQLTSVQAGSLASLALFGMMIGAMLFGTLSDRFGRKKIILLCIGMFSGFTFLGGLASTPIEFGILRFLAGLGIGGVMPNVGALTSEYSPKKLRSTLVAIMFSGYAVGGMTSALLGAWLVPNYGWNIMFYIAGIPLLTLILVWKYLPESPYFLLKNGRKQELLKIIKKISPQTNVENVEIEISSQKDFVAEESSIKGLFQRNRTMNTLLFWTTFFMCLLMVYALGSWLPKLMIQAGYSLGTSMLFLLTLNIGGMIGAIGGGFLADKYHPKKVLTIMYLLGAVALALLGYKSSIYILYGLIAIAGAATIGAQIVLYAFIAQYYPSSIRSTGIGWASGIGRIGAIVGPVLTGALLTLNLPHHMNFLAIAIPGVIAAIAVFLVNSNVFTTKKNIIDRNGTGSSIPN
ncbi:aromatic acid/H+ symport family MFS transporter [Acinetobacter bouvetii]|jgi:AAHS family benzoate transporter-like MFS transporter|uniref:Aromatic acid/H+ symport family MFS transporter n=1 Tax=Acinetobacter bouvetii TaxID=202951 RepID=A0A4Q7ASQ5_9GAMM|nr:aromatic acid/H+ symport family MFS transporter [Acinetobacter bouvetii]RZG65968.1 aromatic acid/H+ symport family MFS transporter [Acinetobacter bouvetii]